MNLADIRKKAEESRRSVADTSVRAEKASLEIPEDFYEQTAVEEVSEPEYEMLTDDIPEVTFIPADKALEDDFCEQESIVSLTFPGESLSDSLPILDYAKDKSENPTPPQTIVLFQNSKNEGGYNPLKTILSGRDSASEGDENALLQTTSYSSSDFEEYLCFRVADEVYAISIMSIKEIIKPREVTEVPRMPSFIPGVLSLRGVITPVMDMRLRLSLPLNANTGRERIVVLKRDSGFCGVLVDEVIQVARINRTDIEEPPSILEGIDREFVSGLGHIDHRMLILLNLETILDIGIN